MKQIRKYLEYQYGFTLIELILYMGISAIFLSGAVLFSWNVILSSEKSTTQQIVASNAQLAQERIAYELRNAESIYALSANSICLQHSDALRNPTFIHLNAQAIAISWGGGSNDCTNLTSSQNLTSSNVTASNLQFTDQVNTAQSRHIQYIFTVESDAIRQEWQKSVTTSASVEMRN